MKFVQILEFKTSNIDEMIARGKQYEQEVGDRGTGKAMICRDRDNEGTYMIVGTWNSHEEAMQNNDLPETQALAADMAKLSDGPPTFRNLDLLEEVG